MYHNSLICKQKIACKTKNKTIPFDPEDALFKLTLDKNKYPYKKNVEKICLPYDKYVECSRARKPLNVLKEEIELREKAIKAKIIANKITHEAAPEEIDLKDIQSLIKLGKLPKKKDEDVELKEASPVCSELFPSLLRNRLISQTDDKQWNFNNPIVLQKQLKTQDCQRFNQIKFNNIFTECCKNCCCIFFKSPTDSKQICKDCLEYEKDLYKITDDLEKYFKVNVILGTKKINRESVNIKYRTPLPIACLYVAYGETYETREENWTKETIDEILEIGKKLLDKSIELNYRNYEGDFDIIPVIVDKSITLQICPILCNGQGGLAYSDPNIFQSLTCFFNERQACIFHSNNVYLLIWKQCQNFKVFDPNGRKENCERDDENGFAALIETKHLSNVIHILVNLSGLNYNEEFKLYEIKINGFRDIEINLSYMKPEPKKRRHFLRINNSFSLIPAAVGIDPEKYPKDRNISIFVCFVAIVYSFIDPPNYWTRKVISQLITSSVNNYKFFMKIKQIINFNIFHLPKIFVLGTYRILINYCPYFYCGHINKCLIFKHSGLIKGLEVLFKTETAGLLQIDNSTIAMWYYQELYFVFDPFERDRIGRVIDEDNEEKGVGCLQIHTNFDSMCRILYRNSLKMIEDVGNFFIHAIKIESVNIISVNTNHSAMSNNEGVLKFNFPILCEFEHVTNKPKIYTQLQEVPDYCLSLLSISPCKRTCSESEFKMAKRKKKLIELREKRMQIKDSLTSLEDGDQVPEYDAEEIVESTINIIMCIVMSRIKAKMEKEENEVGTLAKIDTKENEDMISLTSKESEKEVQQKRFDDDILYPVIDPFEIDSNKEISLEDELEKTTNFISLPDGNWIISGDRTLYSRRNKDEQTVAILSSIAANIVTRIYDISTWNKKILDFIMKSGRDIQTNLQPKNIILSILKNKLSNFEIDSKIFDISIKKMNRCHVKNLKTKLKRFLNRYSNLLILCTSYTGAIFKRNNFVYLFIPYPCDLMGFRMNTSGRACFLRILDFKELVRRINFNRFSNDNKQKFLILPLSIKIMPKKKPEPEDDVEEKDVEEDDELLKEEIKKEQEKFTKFKEELAKKEAEKREKGGKENTKVKNKEEKKKKKKTNKEDEKKEDEIKPKHIPGRTLSQTDPIYEDYKKQIKEPLGYRLCDEMKCLFKIQGTFALEKRLQGNITEIRACFFTAVYAIMNSIVVPLSQWNYRRVDKCLENGLELFEKAEDKTTSITQDIKTIIIDGYKFDVRTEIFKPFSIRPPLDVVIEKISINKRYFIIQLNNNSFAVYKDKCFHLFDPYPSSEKNSPKKEENEGSENEDNEESKCQFTDLEVFYDEDTASWILFADLDTMIKYIEKRALSDNWKFDYRIHVLKILSHEKLSEKIELYWQSINEENLQKDSENIDDISCLKPEKIEWLEMPIQDSIPWSRLSRKICNRYPDIPSRICKRGTYEIEIPERIYSLWGNLRLNLSVFNEFVGEQILAVNVMACCMAHIYRFNEWNTKIIDEIVKNGDKYYQNSVIHIKKDNYRLKLEDLETEYNMENIHFQIHIEGVFYGKLYSINQKVLSLSKALTYLFTISRYGIIQCANKTLSFGRYLTKGYFLFDCQSKGKPLFEENQEKAYVLWCKTLKDLLYCIIMTLRIPYHNVHFFIYKVEVSAREISKEDEEDQTENKEGTKTD